jgi:putative transposase
MKSFYPTLSLSTLCGLFGKTRQGYYEASWQAEERVMEHAIILKLVEQIRSSMPRIGTRKLLHLLSSPLKNHGIKIGRDKLFELLDIHRLLIRRRKKRPVTTNSNHPFKKYHNLIKGIIITNPEQVWVSDITYIAVGNAFNYLNLITDAYSHKIVGYALSTSLEAKGTLHALRQALQQRQYFTSPLIHHSDRGIQYCCNAYTDLLEQHDVRISMAKKGDPYENAIAERVNGILKTELGLDKTFDDHHNALKAVEYAIHVYNAMRPHDSCDKLTPQQAHQQTGTLRKRWKNYYQINQQKGFLRHITERVITETPVSLETGITLSDQVIQKLHLCRASVRLS